MKAKTAVLIAVAVLVTSCTSTKSLYETPLPVLSTAKKPVTVVSVSVDTSRFSCLVIDGRGRVFVVEHQGLSSLRPGDVIK